MHMNYLIEVQFMCFSLLICLAWFFCCSVFRLTRNKNIDWNEMNAVRFSLGISMAFICAHYLIYRYFRYANP